MAYYAYGPPPMPYYGYGFAAPAPIPNLWRDNPQGAIRDLMERETSTSPSRPNHLGDMELYTKNADWLKVIMSVLKTRLGCEWPQNYKAILYLEKMPEAELAGVHDELKKIIDAGDKLRGHQAFQAQAKALLGKAEAEKKKAAETEEKKKYEEMWKKHGGLPFSGWAGWPFPPRGGLPPGTAAQWASQYPFKGPEGFAQTPASYVPQEYPYSRSFYYAGRPEDEAKKPSMKSELAWALNQQAAA
ncbi:hypothetical protein I350_06311 [Cryptococcus amylolentus CBS 6273]|uniref:Uncharacterized protein n=1 Tax=Cryptococcus amylolentus CBS 6273 TaxID=1296118 RepID=A0A1E3JKU7_9TREE|nr:hypothetical protein I350_06311 [Cryptococcus amylolentus CBS 6273]